MRVGLPARRRRSEWSLPEVRVGTWGGFVFINMDPDAEPLESFLGDLPEHFAKWPLEQRYKAVHVAKVFPTNWKVVQEAFMEAFHVVATHPQLLAGIGDANSQYDWNGQLLPGHHAERHAQPAHRASSRPSSRCSTR